jgi:hypothetical protein
MRDIATGMHGALAALRRGFYRSYPLQRGLGQAAVRVRERRSRSLAWARPPACLSSAPIPSTPPPRAPPARCLTPKAARLTHEGHLFTGVRGAAAVFSDYGSATRSPLPFQVSDRKH